MAFRDHALDNARIRSCSVYWPLSEIVASNKKRSLEPITLEHVQKLGCVKIRPVVVCQGHDVVLHAVIYIVVVRNFPKQGSRIVKRACSGRGRI